MRVPFENLQVSINFPEHLPYQISRLVQPIKKSIVDRAYIANLEFMLFAFMQ